MSKIAFAFLLGVFAVASGFAQGNSTSTTEATCQSDRSSPSVAPKTDSASTAEHPAVAAAEAESEARQLARIPNLHFCFTDAHDNTLLAFSPASASQLTYFELKSPPKGLLANYQFPGQTGPHPLYPDPSNKDAKVGKILMPPGVDMVLVSLVSCSDACLAPRTANAPYSCPLQQNATASDASGSPHASSPQTQTACNTVNIVFVTDLIASTGDLLPAFILTSDGLEISEALLEKAESPGQASFSVNGTPICEYFSKEECFSHDRSTPVLEPLFGWSSVTQFHIDRYPFENVCRLYSSPGRQSLDLRRTERISPVYRDNGIVVAPSKIFDTFTLRQMLANTASQLAGVSGFNQASITGALGNLQGITTDTSYLSAQATTVPTPTVSSVAVNGGTGSNTLANTLAVNSGLTGSTSTIVCPAGTLPAVGTSGLPACAPLTTGGTGGASTGVGNPNGGTSTLGNAQNNTSTALNSSNTGVQTANQQNTVTTTSGGQGGTVAPIPVSAALAAPTNIGISASDMLAEQVQLNSQITTLRLLLQGALSDQYLIKESRAVGTRQQTTLGFGISLNPPQRFKHAVAEVRVWIDSPPGQDPVSVMNLLPADKTYNVAKITSKSNSFGAGAVIESVNVGVAGGGSKSRLYLAKDTDTVALQFSVDDPAKRTNGAEVVPRSTQEHIRDFGRQAEVWQSIKDSCEDDPDPDGSPVIFGWQFRPVLGADYVAPGQRQVYAQLALPIGLGDQFTPFVHIQTRWREYDVKRQVVGPVYKGSCSISEDSSPVTVISPLRVHETNWDDMGSGMLKVTSTGNFFSSGFSVLTGPNTLTPTTFDGKSIQFFGNASNLLMTSDLKLLGEDGRATDLGMESQFGPQLCGISKALPATMTARPRPDGNSLVTATITTGPSFAQATDKEPHTLILIGTQVYGLHETPFIGSSAPGGNCLPAPEGGLTCTYRFLASTEVLRQAQTFTLEDLSWKEFRASGTIDFGPSFTALATLGTPPTGVAGAAPAPVPALFTLSGFDLDKVTNLSCIAVGCLQLYRGLSEFILAPANFQHVSKTNAVLLLPPPAPAYDYKSLRFIWHGADGTEEWDLSVPQETKTAVTATPSAILNEGDSTQLVFNGISLLSTQPITLTFDNMMITSGYTYDSSKKTLTVEITTAMTSRPGHKEMTLAGSVQDSDGTLKPSRIQLPFDVTKR